MQPTKLLFLFIYESDSAVLSQTQIEINKRCLMVLRKRLSDGQSSDVKRQSSSQPRTYNIMHGSHKKTCFGEARIHKQTNLF